MWDKPLGLILINIRNNFVKSCFFFSLQKNPVMITDLRDDMKAECEKFGEVRKVIVFDVSVYFLF